MLFRYRPRQTWMPYRIPRPATKQEQYNLDLQQQFESTRTTATAPLGDDGPDVVARLKDLAALREAGALNDAEFERAKAAILPAAGHE